MADKVCYWDNDDSLTMIHNKKAIEACMFLMFMFYTGLSIFTELKSQTDVSY